MLKETQIDPQPQQLTVASTLPVLAFDFEGLKAWATGLTERYHGLVVTEDAIADVKRDMAALNKTKKAVDDARKEAVRQVSEPIRAFEAQIKDVVGIFDATYAALGAQVKAFEDAQRDEKRGDVGAIITQECASALGEDSSQWPAIPVQDRWLNKTTSFKSIREDIQAIIQRHLEDEQRRQALEQARQDRAAAVESHVKGMNERHGLDLPIARFLSGAMDMQQPLDQVLRRIDGEFARAVERREAEKPIASATPVAAPSLPTMPAAAAPAPHPVPQPAGTGTTRAMSIVLEYDVANEAQVQACLDTLKRLCVNFGARIRQA